VDLPQLSLLIFTFFSSLRIVSYVPQIVKVARDKNGASAISCMTWSLWTFANLATAFYAAINLKDRYLTAVSGVYALCCVVVILLTIAKRLTTSTSSAISADDRRTHMKKQRLAAEIATVVLSTIKVRR
jgi:hypothetical protein